MPATAKTSKAQPTIVSMFKKGAVAAPVVRVVEPNKGDTHYDLWSSGKYKSIPDGPTPRLASLHLFLVAEGTVRGFKNHQNDTNKVLKLWLKEFDRAKLADEQGLPTTNPCRHKPRRPLHLVLRTLPRTLWPRSSGRGEIAGDYPVLRRPAVGVGFFFGIQD